MTIGKQGKWQTHAMKARALLIDMECGPLQETMRSPIGSLFDHTQYNYEIFLYALTGISFLASISTMRYVMDVSGSGNNFAHGHYSYGPQYRPNFEEGLRKNAEHCDSLQTFLVAILLTGSLNFNNTFDTTGDTLPWWWNRKRRGNLYTKHVE